MVGVPRRPGERQKLWSAGEYTLLADSHITEDRLTYSRGDTFVLDEGAATRLGNAGAITPPGGMHAVRARVESGKGSKRDEYLYRMWELAGALAYSTFLGGGGGDTGGSIAVQNGRAYVTGETRSADFPTTAGAFDRTCNGNLDAFVSKLNASGSALNYSTILGGRVVISAGVSRWTEMVGPT